MKLILKKRLLQGPPSELCGHPAWRWRYALALFGAHVRAPQGADPLVREAVVYLQARATNGPRADRRFGPLVRAARIYAASGTERWMIEALLLGGPRPGTSRACGRSRPPPSSATRPCSSTCSAQGRNPCTS